MEYLKNKDVITIHKENILGVKIFKTRHAK